MVLAVLLQQSALLTTCMSNKQNGSHNDSHQPLERCPTWMYRPKVGRNCTCGIVNQEIILCDNKSQKVIILDGYIMTYNEKEDMVEAGQSLYGWRKQNVLKGRKKLYFHVEPKRENLSAAACDRYNREGRLCGKCKEGFSPLVYSYELRCVNCTNPGLNVVTFIAVAFVPLTMFYLFVVFFKFNANSPALQAYILGAQTMCSPIVIRYIIARLHTGFHWAYLLSIFGIWNLDFFRPFYSDICMNMSTLAALSLDYAVAFYPLLLMFLTFVVTRLHARGYRVVTLAWYPIRRCVKVKWDSKSSLIDVMATFILLTYTKLLSVSFELLDYTYPFNLTGKHTGLYPYNDATVEYFGKEHRPYGIMAILFLVVFNFAPFLLLVLYPMTCFQKCLNRFKLSHAALHTFVESFVGYYKDGTEPGTRDCRYFAALFFLLRILFYITLAFTKNTSFIIIYCSFATIFAILFTIFKPYKSQYSVYNTITIVFILLGLAFCMLLLGLFVSEIIHDQEIVLLVFGGIFGSVPPLYVVALALWWIWKHNPMKRCFSMRRRWRQERLMTSESLFNAAEARNQSDYGTLQ